MHNNIINFSSSGIKCLPAFLALCLLALFSCNRNDALDTLSADDGDGVITLGAGVNLQTKATDNGFELTDTLGLYLCKWNDAIAPGTLTDSGNYADNARFHLIGIPDTWQPDQPYYYPADGSKLDFYAYYPYRTPAFGSGTVIDLRVAANQSAYADYTRSDFMTANVKGVARSSQKVHLDFYHRLSQIVFVLAPGTGFTKDDLRQAKVKIINAITNARFNLAEIDSVPVAGTTRQDITPCGAWTDRGDSLGGVMAIMVPQQVNTTTYVEVMIGSRRFTFKPVDPFTLNPGCSHVFTIRVNNTGIDIETQIHPWNSCRPLNGDAVEEEEVMRGIATGKSTIFRCTQTGDLTIDWGDGERVAFPEGMRSYTHKYLDGIATHEVIVYGKIDAITLLYLPGFSFTALDVSKNIALESLTCGVGRLTVLDVTQNKALKIIECDKNQLKNINLSQNILLERLSCEDNQLTTLNVSQNSALLFLECSSNQLDSLDVSRNIALTDLYCENNRLTALDVSNNKALKLLWCVDNPLVTDSTALVALANGLPQRDANARGSLVISNSTSALWIQAICDEKNWIIE